MVKQVIVIRKFKGLRTGKYIAQGAHAAIGALMYSHDKEIQQWKVDGDTKIVVYVETERELFDLQDRCEDAKIPCYMVTDAGRTEFGRPTVTALGIGPFDADEINKITGQLPLF